MEVLAVTDDLPQRLPAGLAFRFRQRPQHRTVSCGLSLESLTSAAITGVVTSAKACLCSTPARDRRMYRSKLQHPTEKKPLLSKLCSYSHEP